MASFNDLSRQFTRRLDRAIDNVLDSSNLSKYGEVLRRGIVTRSRAGFGVSEDGARQRRFRRLSPVYIQHRRVARREGQLSSTTSPARSNVTFTGEMLDSIRSRVNDGAIILSFGTPEALRKAEELHQRGRPFFFLSGPQLQKLTRDLNSELRREILRLTDL